MFSKTIPLKKQDKIMRLDEVLNLLPFFEDQSILKKVGEDYDFEKFEKKIQLYPLMSDTNEEIIRINYAKFTNDVLSEIDSYRLIKQDVYKKLGSYLREIKEPGEYVIASKQIPKFKILVRDNEYHWAYESLEISPFNNKEFLKYLPENSKDSSQYPDKIVLQGQLKRESILNEVYREILKNYKNQ